MADPKDTLLLLDRLEELGFDDLAFAKLHHFRERDSDAGIVAHRAYCEKTTTFQDDGTNAKVQERLRLVLSAYVLAGFTSNSPLLFVHLAEAAYIDIA